MYTRAHLCLCITPRFNTPHDFSLVHPTGTIDRGAEGERGKNVLSVCASPAKVPKNYDNFKPYLPLNTGSHRHWAAATAAATDCAEAAVVDPETNDSLWSINKANHRVIVPLRRRSDYLQASRRKVAENARGDEDVGELCALRDVRVV